MSCSLSVVLVLPRRTNYIWEIKWKQMCHYSKHSPCCLTGRNASHCNLYLCTAGAGGGPYRHSYDYIQFTATLALNNLSENKKVLSQGLCYAFKDSSCLTIPNSTSLKKYYYRSSNTREKVGKTSPRVNRKAPLGGSLHLDWLTLLVNPHPHSY